MYGDQAMLLPPGHSSSEKIIGQFSIVTLTPLSWACLTMSGQTRSASAQFSSRLFFESPPMNVFMKGTPIFEQACMTSLMWAMAGSRTAGSG
jgi:hypothetical protein